MIASYNIHLRLNSLVRTPARRKAIVTHQKSADSCKLANNVSSVIVGTFNCVDGCAVRQNWGYLRNEKNEQKTANTRPVRISS
jgi:hypothetical protein